MATTYEAIATVTVGSGGAASIQFTSIPQTYTDLCIKMSVRSTAANFSIYIRPNGSTTNLSSINLQGNGSAINNFTGTTIQALATSSGDTASTFGNSEFYIPNYTGSTNKSISSDGVSENNATGAYTRLVAGLWSQTSAITSIDLVPDTGDFAQYSTATLYGIKNS